MTIEGTFEITMKSEPPYDTVDDVPLSRASFDKVFSGGIVAKSHVEMLAARTPVEGSAGYVALERIVGVVDGREGSFAVLHMGLMSAGARSLRIHVVPGSGTGALRGIDGTMDIQVVDGHHRYSASLTFA